MTKFLLAACVCGAAMGCAGGSGNGGSEGPGGSAGTAWTVVLHGGAGTLERDLDPELTRRYRASLDAALREGKRRAEAGEGALDIAEAVVRVLEDDELFNAGRGAALTERGRAELDASIMDGATLKAGAVAGVTTVKNPVSLARQVMEKTRHVLLAGDGAEQFATTVGAARVPNDYFVTERRKEMLRRYLAEQKAGGLDPSVPLADGRSAAWSPMRYGTVGCVVRDKAGNLAAATSTGGLTGKKWGRIGDSPLIGAGCYANRTVAVSCTGTGEQFIRHTVAAGVAARMELAGQSVSEAADHLIFKVLNKDDGGLIAVDAQGRWAMPYSSEGMYRGVADSTGTFVVRIWED